MTIAWNVDGVIGIGIAATAVGLIAGGIAAAVSRKKWANYLLWTLEITVWLNPVLELLYLKELWCMMLFSYY